MRYLKWRLSEGRWGTGPEETIADRGGWVDAGPGADPTHYLVGYLSESADLTGLETWDVTELTQSEALAYALELDDTATLMDDGRFTSALPHVPPDGPE